MVTCTCIMGTKQPNKCFVPLKKLTGCPRSGKSRGGYFFKVRKLSGNFVISQGIFVLSIKSGKSQGILKKQVREKSGDFEITPHGIK